jgi:immune inhibitor A
MKKYLWFGGAIFLAVAILVGVFVFVGAVSSPVGVADDPATVVQSGPKLWQEKEPLALVPSQRDTNLWRSVRVPPAGAIEAMLEDQGKIALDASPAEREQAVKEWMKKAVKDANFGPDPRAYDKLMAREKALLNANLGSLKPEEEGLPTPKKNVLGVVVEFAPPGGSEVVSRSYPLDPTDPSLGCTTVDETFYSLSRGDDPPPGPRDNFGFYKADGFTIEEYKSAFFDIGPDAGYGVVREDLGGIDLSGYSLNNYLLEMSGGTYTTTGDILSVPVTLTHSHEYYGLAVYSEDGGGNCVSPTFSDARYSEYINDIIDAMIAEFGDTIDWSQFDADGDQIIDLLVTIHAGYAFQNGGGEDRLSTTSSSLFPNNRQIGGLSTPGDPSDDYYIEGFNVDPEQLDVGALAEEFEHQFGLPDLYSTDASNSNAWWGAHSSGVWGGPLGGTRPVGHNLWQDWMLGWRDPLVIEYNDLELLTGQKEVVIGRARYTPEDTEDGVIVRLPTVSVLIENLAGSGVGWFSDSGDEMDHRVYRNFDLSTATAPITFTFDASWDIEVDWDYGYLEVSTDGGTTWTSLPDIDGVLTDTDPNGNNLGWGLTGSGDGTLMFDLSAYAGETIGLRFRYLTDVAVSNPGWWVDNLLLEDDSGVLYENDLETDFSDWTNEGWIVVPYERIDERYYTIEWRDNNGFDQSLDDPYYPVYDTPVEPPPEFEVDRLAATTPGMLIAFRNTGQGFDYTLLDSLGDAPSYGPKYGLITIDAHNGPVRFDTTFPSFQDGWVGYTMYGRTKSGHATFGQVPTNEWTAHLGYDYETGEYLDTPLETKTWPSMPPVMTFHDSYGYYPGFYYPGTGSTVYLHDSDSSAAIPAKESYTTRITDPDGNLLEYLYGVAIGPAGLGSGNPGDDHVQYGLHVEVVDSSDEMGTIHIWNNLFEVEASVETDITILPDSTGTISMTIDENIGGALAEPYIVIELPDELGYIDDTNFGGLVPLDGSFESAEQIVEIAANEGLDVLQSDVATAGHVKYLAWTGDDIATQMGSMPFGFGAVHTGDDDPTIKVWFFKNGTELFQEEDVVVERVGMTAYMPAIFVGSAEADVRVAHASPDAPAVDVLVNDGVAFSNLAFPEVTDYASLPADTYNIKVVPSGATEPVVIEADLALSAYTDYTVAAANYLGSIEAVIYVDDNTLPAAGKAHVRFIHLSPDAPAVDVAVTSGPILFSNVAFKEASSYLPVDAGTYDLQVRLAGTTTVALSVPGVTLDAGKVYTVFAEGLATGTPALQAVLTVDN